MHVEEAEVRRLAVDFDAGQLPEVPQLRPEGTQRGGLGVMLQSC
jgi:hypothetical protein